MAKIEKLGAKKTEKLGAKRVKSRNEKMLFTFIDFTIIIKRFYLLF